MRFLLGVLSFLLLIFISSCEKQEIVTPEEPSSSQYGRLNIKAGTVLVDTVYPGWDATDATACLQNAIDKGYSSILVRKMDSKWFVNRIYLRKPNQELLFEEGVEVKAIRGEFHPRTSPMFQIQAENVSMIGYGATLSMWKEDYADPDKYEFAEWRHCIRTLGAKNFTIKGLLLKDSGGDGIEVAGDFSGSRETDWSSGLIEDVTADNNYRQGVSICTARDLIIRNSTFKNTSGTRPEAGIDIEPWQAHHQLQGIYVEDCIFENNAGSNIEYTLYWLKNNPPDTISITFENCISINSNEYGILCDVWPEYGPPSGFIKFIDITIKNSKRDGIYIRETDPTKAKLTFDNCTVIDCGIGEYDWYYHYPINLAPWGGDKWENGIIGNLTFDNCKVKDTKNRYAFHCEDNVFSRGGLNNVHGLIKVDNENSEYLMQSFHENDTVNVTLKAVRDTVEDPTGIF
jgi:hypothetical protein